MRGSSVLCDSLRSIGMRKCTWSVCMVLHCMFDAAPTISAAMRQRMRGRPPTKAKTCAMAQCHFAWYRTQCHFAWYCTQCHFAWYCTWLHVRIFICAAFSSFAPLGSIDAPNVTSCRCIADVTSCCCIADVTSCCCIADITSCRCIADIT